MTITLLCDSPRTIQTIRDVTVQLIRDQKQVTASADEIVSHTTRLLLRHDDATVIGAIDPTLIFKVTHDI